jgi:hypothetical protein
VAANGGHYLPAKPGTTYRCTGDVAFWGMHGKADTAIPYTPQGLAYKQFWTTRHGCGTGTPTKLAIADASADDECVELRGCTEITRWCAYNAASGHQVPRKYYARETMAFFGRF